MTATNITTRSASRVDIRHPSAKELIKDISSSDTYIETVSREGLPKAFASAAMALAELETSPTGSRTIEGHYYALLGQLGDVCRSEAMLRKPGLSKDTRLGFKEQLIHFNHDLRDMVDAYQDLTPNEVKRLLAEGYIAANRSSWKNATEGTAALKEVIGSLDSTLDGMWHEITGEMIVGAAGYEIDTDVTPEEEMRGVDGWVHMRPNLGVNKGWMYVDFKATSDKAKQANNMHPDNMAVWSQLSRHDYETAGSFRISPAVARSRSSFMKKDLEDLYSWHTR